MAQVPATSKARRALIRTCTAVCGAGIALDHLALQPSERAALGRRRAGRLLPPTAPEVVFLNTSGGLTAGDRLDYSLDLDADAQARATTQTAERAYRALLPEQRRRVESAPLPGGPDAGAGLEVDMSVRITGPARLV